MIFKGDITFFQFQVHTFSVPIISLHVLMPKKQISFLILFSAAALYSPSPLPSIPWCSVLVPVSLRVQLPKTQCALIGQLTHACTSTAVSGWFCLVFSFQLASFLLQYSVDGKSWILCSGSGVKSNFRSDTVCCRVLKSISRLKKAIFNLGAHTRSTWMYHLHTDGTCKM